MLDHFLSHIAKKTDFPSSGILQQVKEAKSATINATIGVWLADDWSPLSLSSLTKMSKLSEEEQLLYISSFGLQELRERWQQEILRKNHTLTSAWSLFSLPVVTWGLTHGLSVAMSLFVDEETPVLLSDFFRWNYRLICSTRAIGMVQTYTTFTQSWLDLEAFSTLLGQQTQKTVILLNFPNNPAGYQPTSEEVEELVHILKQKAEEIPLVVLCDDAYFGQAYEQDCCPESIFASLASAHPNLLAVKIDGATKEYYARWLRVGFLSFANPSFDESVLQYLTQKAAAFVRWSISNANAAAQWSLVHMLSSPTYIQEQAANKALLASRYHEVKRVLQDPKYTEILAPIPFNAGYFMSVRLLDHDAQEIRKTMLAEHGIWLIAFPGNILRVAYSSVAKEDIHKIFEALYVCCG